LAGFEAIVPDAALSVWYPTQDGLNVGAFVVLDTSDGANDGAPVGTADGANVGEATGEPLGEKVGARLG